MDMRVRADDCTICGICVAECLLMPSKWETRALNSTKAVLSVVHASRLVLRRNLSGRRKRDAAEPAASTAPHDGKARHQGVWYLLNSTTGSWRCSDGAFR